MNHKKYNYQIVTNDQEIEEAYLLWEQCFKDTKEYMDFYFLNKCKDNIIMALTEESASDLTSMELGTKCNKIVSMVHLNPYRINFYSKSILVHYIVGVATKQENRKQGCMRFLIEHSLKEMYQKGELFTYLMPAKEEIYLPFDFRFVYEQHRYEINKNHNIEKLNYSSNGISVIKWIKSTEENKEDAVLFAHKKLSECKNVYVFHDMDYYNKIWNEMQAAGGDLLLFYAENNIVGIASYMQEEKKTEITEIILDTEYTEEIIQYFDLLSSEKGMAITYCDSSFLHTAVLEKKGYVYKKVPIIMARIVNLLQFFLQLEIIEPMYAVLKVKDNIIMENNKTFVLDYRKNGQKKITVTDKEPQFIIDIGTLTSFLLSNKEITKSNGVFTELKKLRKSPQLYINEIT